MLASGEKPDIRPTGVLLFEVDVPDREDFARHETLNKAACPEVGGEHEREGISE